YALVNAGYVRALGLEGLRNSTTGGNMPAANLASVSLGAEGRVFLSALVLFSCLGACMTSLMTAPHVFVALSADELFPRILGKVSEGSAVPVPAVVIAALVGTAYV